MIQYKKCKRCKQISKTIYRIHHHSDICNAITAISEEISSLCRSTAAAVLENDHMARPAVLNHSMKD
jgi:hypothetical protein